MKRIKILIKRRDVEDEEINIALKNQGVLNCTMYHKNIINNEIENILTMGSLDVETGEDYRWSPRSIESGDIVELMFFDDFICDDPAEVSKMI